MKQQLKKTLLIAAVAASPLAIISCDSGSSNNDSSPQNDSTNSDNQSDIDNLPSVTASHSRLIFAGNSEGNQPIQTNATAKVKIDGNNVSFMVNDVNGVLVIDVPFGSQLELSFEAPDGEAGEVDDIYCVYADQPSVRLVESVDGATAGGTLLSLLIDVDNDGIPEAQSPVILEPAANTELVFTFPQFEPDEKLTIQLANNGEANVTYFDNSERFTYSNYKYQYFGTPDSDTFAIDFLSSTTVSATVNSMNGFISANTAEFNTLLAAYNAATNQDSREDRQDDIMTAIEKFDNSVDLDYLDSESSALTFFHLEDIEIRISNGSGTLNLAGPNITFNSSTNQFEASSGRGNYADQIQLSE